MDLEGVTWQGPPISDGEALEALPSSLRSLLRQLNGFILRGGALHLRGVAEDPSWHSLHLHWTGDLALSQHYRSLLPTDVPFAQDCVGDQFLLREEKVWRLGAETDELEALDVDLFAFLERASADPVDYLGAQPLLMHLQSGASLEPGELLHAHPPFCVKQASDGVTLRPVPAEDLLLAHAALAQQLRDLADGDEIRFSVEKK